MKLTVHDIDGDGKPELVYGGEGQMRYAKPDPANPTATWKIHNVSERGFVTAHGVGAGDINGDGRDDIVLGGTPSDPARILSAGPAGQFVRVVSRLTVSHTHYCVA